MSLWLHTLTMTTLEKEYDSVTEQLDKLFHDIDQGKLDKTGSFYTHIQKVKSDAPKE